MQMNYKEKKRSMFFGLPWTFTSYTVTEEIITVDTGLFKKMTVIYTKSLMYVWKVLCWSVCWGLERSIVLRVM